MTPTLHGVALDMDGLLFDTERLYFEVGDTILQRRGHRFTTELQRRMMGRIGLSAIGQMIDFHQLKDDPQSLLDESDSVYESMLQTGLRPMPGLEPFMQTLIASRLPFVLATSSRRKFVDIILATVPWRDELHFILTGDDVTNGKPHPEMYLTAAKKLDIAPERMLVLEDSVHGCAAGVAAGAKTVAIPNMYTRGGDFTRVSMIADSLVDPRLLRWLDVDHIAPGIIS